MHVVKIEALLEKYWWVIALVLLAGFYAGSVVSDAQKLDIQTQLDQKTNETILLKNQKAACEMSLGLAEKQSQNASQTIVYLESKIKECRLSLNQNTSNPTPKNCADSTMMPFFIVFGQLSAGKVTVFSLFLAGLIGLELKFKIVNRNKDATMNFVIWILLIATLLQTCLSLYLAITTTF